MNSLNEWLASGTDQEILDAMPDPWPGFKADEACWMCNRNEPIGPDTFIACYECGHVWTKKALKKARREGYRESFDGIYYPGEPARPWWYKYQWLWKRDYWFKRADHIFFCPLCIHDF